MPVVIDASVALAWMLPDELGEAFEKVLSTANDDPPVVPGLWLYEIANALTVAVRRRRLNRLAADEALDLVAAVPVRVVQLGWLEMKSAYRLAAEYGLSAYNASYLQVANQLGLPLLTLDEPMRKSAKALGIKLSRP